MNNFIKTIKKMQESGEFDRIFNTLKNPKDYETAKQMTRKQRREGMIECMRLKEVDLQNNNGLTVPLITYIDNPLIWRDIVCLMISDEDILEGLTEDKPKPRSRKKKTNAET